MNRPKLIATLLAALGIPAALAFRLHQLPPVERFITLASWEYGFFPLFFVLAPVVWIFLSRRSAVSIPFARLADLGLGLLTSTALTFISLLCLKPTPWIQWDETALAATAQGMHFERFSAFISEVGVGSALPRMLSQDARPPLFPFLVSLLHDVLGYRVENSLLLNGLVLWALLNFIFISIHPKLGLLASIAAQLLVLSESIVLWSAASGSFDLLSLLFLGLMLSAAFKLVASPRRASLWMFLCAGVLYSYSRYESIIGFALTGVSAWWLLRRRRAWHPRFWPLVAPLPILLTPMALYALQSHGGGYAGFSASLSDQFGTPFSVAYLGRNLSDFAGAFFSFRPRGFFFGPIHIAGLAAFAMALRRRWRSSPWVFFFPAAVLSHLLVLLVYVMGTAARTEGLRLFLPITAFCALAPLFLLDLYPGRGRKAAFLAASAALFLWRLQVAVETRAQVTTYEDRASVAMAQLLEQSHLPRKNALYVFEVPTYLITRGYPAIHPKTLRDHWPEIHREQARGAVGKIYFIDIFRANTLSPVKLLARNFTTKEVAALQDPEVSVQVLELR